MGSTPWGGGRGRRPIIMTHIMVDMLLKLSMGLIYASRNASFLLLTAGLSIKLL